MSTPERTQQQLDPAAALGGRVPAIVLCALAVGWALLVLAVLRPESDGSPTYMITFGQLFGAATVIVIASTPAFAPFSMREHLIVHMLTLSAFLVDLITSWNDVGTPLNAWVSACLGLFLIAISPYRPARELVLFGTISIAFMGTFAFLSAQASPGGIRPLAAVLFAVVPALACCYGAARYSSGVVRDFVRWRDRLDHSIADEANVAKSEIYRAVQTKVVGDLAHDVMPLLSDILYQENITEEHRRQARAIAARIRVDLVENVDRTWLETAIAASTSTNAPPQLRDPDNLAAQMDHAQRTALHAFVYALVDDSAARDAFITIHRQRDVCAVTVAARLTSGGRKHQARYGPFLAVMRTTFDGLTADFRDRRLIVKFDYAHR